MLWIGNCNRGIEVTFICFQQTGKLPRRNYLRKLLRTRRWSTILRWGTKSSKEKGETYPMGQCYQKCPSLTRDARSHSTWRQGGKCRRRMASERQMNRLPVLLAVNMIWQQISITNRLTHQSTTPTNKRWQWRTRAEHRKVKSGPPLMRTGHS